MNFKNIINERFGHLTAIALSGRIDKKGRRFWVCRCDCGELIVVRGDNLRNGNSTKCTECRNKVGKPSVKVGEL